MQAPSFDMLYTPDQTDRLDFAPQNKSLSADK